MLEPASSVRDANGFMRGKVEDLMAVQLVGNACFEQLTTALNVQGAIITPSLIQISARRIQTTPHQDRAATLVSTSPSLGY